MGAAMCNPSLVEVQADVKVKAVSIVALQCYRSGHARILLKIQCKIETGRSVNGLVCFFAAKVRHVAKPLRQAYTLFHSD